MRPAFATSIVDGEIWPCLLEKAWAKLHGSYCMTRLGSPTIALTAFTGRSHKIIDHNGLDSKSIFVKLEKYFKSKTKKIILTT